MIKLGQLAQNAANKQFPDNWIALAKMTHINYEHDEKNKTVTLDIDDVNSLIIDSDNHIICDAPLDNTAITAIIIEAVKSSKNKNKMGKF
jgi:hypothetical protein